MALLGTRITLVCVCACVCLCVLVCVCVRERDLHDCAELSMRNAGAGVTIVGLGDELLSLRLAHYHYFNIIDSVINYIVLLLLLYYYCYWSCRSAPLLALHVCVCA